MLNSLPSSNPTWFVSRRPAFLASMACLIVLVGCAHTNERIDAKFAGDTNMPPQNGKTRKILKRVAPDFPATLLKPGMPEIVYVRFTVEPDGHVSLATVDPPIDPELAKLAVEAVKQWLFEPALDQPAVTLRAPFKFSSLPEK